MKKTIVSITLMAFVVSTSAWARYYDASSGRFLQADPDPGKTQSPITVINKYVYAGNSPEDNTDPTGQTFGDVHGNYCGPDANGQIYHPNYQGYIGLNAQPTDRLDRACQRHDSAYNDFDTASSVNLQKAWWRVETDSKLFIEGTSYATVQLFKGHFGQTLEGIAVANGAFIFFAYSLPAFAIAALFTSVRGVAQGIGKLFK